MVLLISFFHLSGSSDVPTLTLGLYQFKHGAGFRAFAGVGGLNKWRLERCVCTLGRSRYIDVIDAFGEGGKQRYLLRKLVPIGLYDMI